MTRPGPRMVDVELVDEQVDGLDGPPDLPGAATGQRPHRGRRNARAVGLVALGLTGALVGWSVRAETVDDRADDAALAAFADVPGVTASLRAAPSEPAQLPVPHATVAGLAIGSEARGDADRLVARDAVTGAPRWVAPFDVPAGGADCPAAVSDGTLVVCEVFGDPGFGGPTTDAVLGGTPNRLVVLAVDDGRAVAERELGFTTIGWAVLGDDLVVATRTGDVATVERSRAADGDPRWRSTAPLPPDVLARRMALTAGAFVVLSGPVAAVLDADDGDVLGTWASPGGRGTPVTVATSAVGFAVWSSPQEGVWFDRLGRPGARLPGTPVTAVVDDGSLPGVLLLTDDGVLRAVDVQRGVLWERPRVRAVPIRLDGLLVLEDDRGVTATDLATGRERWSVAAATAVPDGLVRTDGVRVVTAPRDGAPSAPLAARDLRTGSVTWTSP